jgi:hypothetical protein
MTEGRKDKTQGLARPKATVRDVGRAAGLSVASVSRALSGARPVRPEIARRVTEAAEALGYRPDPVARALSSGSTSSVGLVAPDIVNPFFPALADAGERAVRSAGLSLLLMNADNDPGWEKRCISELISPQPLRASRNRSWRWPRTALDLSARHGRDTRPVSIEPRRSYTSAAQRTGSHSRIWSKTRTAY